MTTIFMRPGVAADIPAIMAIIESARAFLGAQHIDQWQGTYPDEAAVRADIAAGTNRVLIVDGQVAGNANLLPGPDPFYGRIDGAGWVGTADYAAIHRFAMSGTVRGHGLTRVFLSNLITAAYAQGYRDIRIDTHEQNLIMQHVAESNGFEYRGIVYLDEPVPERKAYQLLLP